MRPEVKSILRLEVPIIVQIGRRGMCVENVVALTPGSIIELPKAADEELELLVNNKAIGAGIAVKVGENFGIKISYIGDVRTRIEALGSTLGGPADTHDGVADADDADDAEATPAPAPPEAQSTSSGDATGAAA